MNSRSCHCDGSALIMSLGMLSGPGALPRASFLIQISYTSRVNCLFI